MYESPTSRVGRMAAASDRLSLIFTDVIGLQRIFAGANPITEKAACKGHLACRVVCRAIATIAGHPCDAAVPESAIR